MSDGDLTDQFDAEVNNMIGRIENGGLVLDLRCLTDEAAFLSVLTELNDHALA